MTALAEERVVSAPDTKLLYMARRDSLRLVMQARLPQHHPMTGQKIGETRGAVIPFRDGVFRVPPTGEVTISDPGGTGDWTGPAEEVVAFLERHRLKGDIEEGFWRVDPIAPPVSREELQALTDAAITLDVDKLQAIIDQESAGWKRDDILSTARTALDRVMQVRAEAERVAAEQAKKAK